MRYGQNMAWSEIALKVNLEKHRWAYIFKKNVPANHAHFSDLHSQFATDFKINFRIPKYRHNITSIIANICSTLKRYQAYAFVSIHYCVSLLQQLHKARMIGEHVQGYMANKVLGLGFEVISPTPEPTHRLWGYTRAVRGDRQTGAGPITQGLDRWGRFMPCCKRWQPAEPGSGGHGLK